MAHQLRVHRLQLRPTPGRNTPALKTALYQALHALRLRGAHLPPGAVLVVRHLDALPPFPRQAGAALGWQRQLVARLDRVAATAPRPTVDHVPADAAAVLFSDEVELLLCYTRDLLVGRSRWYWRDLFPGNPAPAGPNPASGALVSAWVTYPRALPATVAALDPVEVQRAFAGLGPRPLSRLAHALRQTFSLPGDLPRPAPAEPTGENGGPQGSAPPPAPGGDLADPISPASPAGPPPWQQALPPALQGALAPRAAYVAGLCYTLFHHPQRARDPQFAREAAAWLAHTPPHAGSPSPAASRRPAPPPAAGTPSAPHEQPPSRPAHTPRPEETPDIKTGIPTRLGGAFYLVNLLTRLPLPGPLAALNPWELLLALTATLLDTRYVDYEQDPLWPLLRELARLDPDELWGASLPPPPDHFRLPPSWPGQAGPTVAHPDPGEPEQPPLSPSLAERLAPPLGWWLMHLLPPLHTRLQQLLADPEWEPETLLNRPASLALTRTHLDVRFSLEDVDIRARRAGLDRNPGWQPAFARVITFHFLGGVP